MIFTYGYRKMARNCSHCLGEIQGRGPQAKYCGAQCKNLARPTSGKGAARYMLREERRELMNSIKMAKGCEVCGYKEHPAALTFDHLDPTTKSFSPTHGTHRSIEKMMQELEKCRVLCANCHNIHSHNQRVENGS